VKKVLLAGEGRTEIGGEPGWGKSQRARIPAAPGVLEAIARKATSGGWEVAERAIWRQIPLYQAGRGRGPETRRILRLLQDAKERHFDAVLFTRDQDTGRDAEDRREDFARGVVDAALIPGAPPFAGGLAVPEIEGWVAAFVGVSRTETMSKPAVSRALRERGIDDTVQSKVEAIENATSPPATDATNLTRWLDEARRALARVDALPVDQG
jgi:hypothetical protein